MAARSALWEAAAAWLGPSEAEGAERPGGRYSLGSSGADKSLAFVFGPVMRPVAGGRMMEIYASFTLRWVRRRNPERKQPGKEESGLPLR